MMHINWFNRSIWKQLYCIATTHNRWSNADDDMSKNKQMFVQFPRVIIYNYTNIANFVINYENLLN